MPDAKKVALLPAAGPQTLSYVLDQWGPLPQLPLDFEQLNAHLPYDIERILDYLKPPLENQSQNILIPNITLLNLLPQLQERGLDTTRCINYKASPLEGARIAILGSKYTIADSTLFPKSTRAPIAHATISLLEKLRHTFYASKEPTLAKEVYEAIPLDLADYYVIACSELSVAFAEFEFGGKKYDLLQHLHLTKKGV